MSLISLASVQASGPSGVHLNTAQSEASSSIARLSSGNAIVRAGDDVAGMSVSTGMQTRITSLRSSLINTLQASSMLQVADGGLSQIQDILERMNALSTQANGGSLAETERSFLNLEFQELKEEITRISDATNFNGVSVLKAGEVDASQSLKINDSIAEKASAYVDFNNGLGNVASAGETFIIQGLTFTFQAGVPTTPLGVQVGADAKETVTNLLQAFNDFIVSEPTDGLLLSQVVFENNNDGAFSITSRTGGELSQNFTINLAQSTSRTSFDVSNAVDVGAAGGNGSFLLNLADSNALGANSTQVSGVTSAGGLVSDQSQTSGEVRFVFNANPTGGAIGVDSGFGTISPLTTLLAFGTDIPIGATIEETIDNAVQVLTEYTDSTSNLTQSIRQLEYFRDEQNLVVRYKGVGNPENFLGTDVRVARTGTTAITLPSGGTFDAVTGGTNSGVNTEGVINSEFVGQVSGFEAEYVSTNRMNLSLTVGESTYEATFNTDFTSHQTVRLNSEDGGYLDVTFNADNNSVLSQDDADVFAGRVDQAMEGLTFYQERNVSSFVGSDLLRGTTLDIRLDDFSENIIFDSFEIHAYDADASTANPSARMEVVIDGERFRSVEDIGETITAYQHIVMQSLDNPERRITFTNSDTELAIKTTANADMLKEAFLRQLPIGEAGSGVETISFQVDESADNQLEYAITTISTQTLFVDSEGLNIATSEAANEAFTAIKEAIDTVTSRRAYVGALQSQSDYIYSTLESSIISHEAARGVIADTDISAEATAFAQSQVRIQAAIAVGAQANVLRSTVLDIIEAL